MFRMKRENLFLLLLTHGGDDKTFIGFGDLSNIKIYSVSPRISNSASSDISCLD